MATPERTRDEVEAWLTQYAAVSEVTRGRAAAVAEQAWAGFDQWYNVAAVAVLARELAGISTAAQQTAVGAGAQYVDTVVGLLTGRVQRLPAPQLQPIREGADPVLVHMRPAKAYRDAVATGASVEEALRVATERAGGLMLTDVSLTERATERGRYQAAAVKLYRRVIRPELSKSGSCGLCIVASDQIYSVEDLLPIHPPTCKCRTLPIVAGNDPGREINVADLKALYAAAGDSTNARDLKRVRGRLNADGTVEVTGKPVKVRRHGEHGPVLTRAGDKFRGPKDVPLEDDPDRAARMLEKLLPVLDGLEQRAVAGEDVAAPLKYQRDLVARLRGITGQRAA